MSEHDICPVCGGARGRWTCRDGFGKGSDEMARPKIVYGATGSVATIKFLKLLKRLREFADVKAVVTESGGHFVQTTLNRMSEEEFEKDGVKELLDCIVSEDEEWGWREIGDPIPHIDLKDWADILVIAPLSANTMAKMANGLCDNLLTSIYRAWPMDKPIIVAPAMNTDMWNHPITREQLVTLTDRHFSSRYLTKEEKKFNPITHQRDNLKTNIFTRVVKELSEDILEFRRFHVMEPMEAELACGTTGKGAMAPYRRIAEVVKEFAEAISA